MLQHNIQRRVRMFNIYKIAAGLTCGISAHGVGMVAQYTTVFGLTTLGASPIISIPISIIVHELVENAVSSQGIIAVYNQDGAIATLHKLLEPIAENPAQVFYVGLFSYATEKIGSKSLLHSHSHHGCHHHHHGAGELLVEGTLSTLGSYLGVITYDYIKDTYDHVVENTLNTPQEPISCL